MAKSFSEFLNRNSVLPSPELPMVHSTPAYFLKNKERITTALAANLVNDPFIEETAREWIFKTPVHSNAWIDVYLALVKKHPDDRDLRELGFGWLKEEAGGLRRWPEVYDAVVGSNSDEASKTLLVEWLLRANTEMKSWPKAAASFLKANPDNAQVREAVQKWLAQKPDRVEAWDLGALINTEITA